MLADAGKLKEDAGDASAANKNRVSNGILTAVGPRPSGNPLLSRTELPKYRHVEVG